MELSPSPLPSLSGLAASFTELVTHCRHIVCCIDGNQNGLPFSIVIGQVTFSQQPELLALPFEKFLHDQAIARPMAGLINRTAPLDLFGFTPPKDGSGIPGIVWPWTDHYLTVLRHSLHIRQMQFDQYGRPLPNLCAKQLYIAQRHTLLWHDTKSFAGWFFGNWRRWSLS
ncbi:hypothetical protein [Pseudogulbenkiania sp. MAI-1]|uniref:hypothetical protein n=1 Tax=Pseudogulbenkiania sp. MAI-1 TaxID=990370 RepID=UPI0012ECB341|nr:hypothetical protein [Pseudogulbenkiania sp. MAI-1]